MHKSPITNTAFMYVITLIAATIVISACSHPPENRKASMEQASLIKPELWVTELEKPGEVTIRDDMMEIDVPAGATVWFKRRITGPVKIRYQALVVSAGGPNDRVSDLNCFWLARDVRDLDNLLQVTRHGAFTEYDQLQCYYVGLGANGNSTTRFRRYVGQYANRPLLPEHDLKEPLIVPNVWHTVELQAEGSTIRYLYDGKVIFDYQDPEPYTSGWFGLRTVANHLKIRQFQIAPIDSLRHAVQNRP